MLANKVYKKEVMKNGIKVYEISTPILILDETKRRYLKRFVKEVKMAEKAINSNGRFHLSTRIHIEINHCSNLDIRGVLEIKVTKSNLQVTISRANDDGEIEYVKLKFPIKIIDSVSAEVF